MMKHVYSVGQVNKYIKNMFAQDFMLHHISIKGEVSNCKYHSSGHIYFTIGLSLQDFNPAEENNTLTAVSISDLSPVIEKLESGADVPHTRLLQQSPISLH